MAIFCGICCIPFPGPPLNHGRLKLPVKKGWLVTTDPDILQMLRLISQAYSTAHDCTCVTVMTQPNRVDITEINFSNITGQTSYNTTANKTSASCRCKIHTKFIILQNKSPEPWCIDTSAVQLNFFSNFTGVVC